MHSMRSRLVKRIVDTLVNFFASNSDDISRARAGDLTVLSSWTDN
eukprot:CCRYP_014338-RA/>CCRYP_014338-RA protein AED:0.00 eAED:0.00 QI:119/1/1/1/0/0/2/38/44